MMDLGIAVKERDEMGWVRKSVKEKGEGVGNRKMKVR